MRRHSLSCFGLLGALTLFLLLDSTVREFVTDDTTGSTHVTNHPQVFLPHPIGLQSAPSLQASACTRFLYNASSKELAGNGRALLALLLTSLQYHGVRRLKETLPTWMDNFLVAQGNVDMVIFYAYSTVTAARLVETFGLAKASTGQLTSLEIQFRNLRADVAADVSLTAEEWASLGDGYFYLPSVQPMFVFRLVPVNVTFPLYIQANRSLLEDPTWLRCGCPPFCPLHRSPPEYIQGTRWYSHALFDQPIVRRYSFWVKLDVDVAFFLRLQNNLVHLLLSSGRLLGHTGYTYNGHGCSDELQDAIWKFLRSHNTQAVSASQDWWLSDDRTYYTNFVVGSVNFFLQPAVRELTAYLNEYRDGFFKHRWTDQSLLHKVMGVFCGPHEATFSLNWEKLRCSKKRTTPDAVFYHSKRRKRIRPGKPCRL
ncbi:hypothetical protein TraAM80_08278 [Trypanosoma rangeli]|uniref:Hexosyltransferase n=1 Tax=Trypanosoma rangeli TaxID=5698 RepID=A0A3R7RBE5_TRYRA|nr:uncharacterized protein TraAM80_08278 [Trypanosoma rangeli]RNE99280.1 hypothetical protein TraAM80_08278 [Trypanosoma rangeli]|eukprot:RNE99280.1 hypothetical protein TraAM80_08278 [Trypanosoma rangeli]